RGTGAPPRAPHPDHLRRLRALDVLPGLHRQGEQAHVVGGRAVRPLRPGGPLPAPQPRHLTHLTRRTTMADDPQGAAIEDYLIEDRTFPPPPGFVEGALLSSPSAYDDA